MKRLILISTLLLCLIASCDSPVSNSTRQAPNPVVQPGLTAPLTTFSRGGVEPDTARKAMWGRFKAQNGNDWKVRWNKHTGLPASIISGLSKKKYTGSAEQAARAFLSEHKSLFGVSNLANLKYVKTQTYRGIRHVTFNQTVKGVPVYEAEYKVHLRANGQVDMANGTYYPNIKVSTGAGISQAQARSTAAADMNITDPKVLQAQSEKVIYLDGENFRLAWKLVLFSKDPVRDWFYMIDAQSGEILEKLNLLTDVTGDGDVYPTHPGLSSVSNKPLFGLLGNGRLDGTYVDVDNASASEAYASNHSFVYSTTNTHFDEVSLYYHVDNFRRNFVEALDAGNQLFNKLNATAHDNSTCFNNACFSPSTGDLYFSDISDFAKEDKVVHHEYGHAVIYDIQSGIQSSSDEEGAISEGTPDYFAGTFTNRAKIGEYVFSSPLRNMNNPGIASYSAYQNEPTYPNVDSHKGGEFFSSILWDLRNGSVGKDATDKLVYAALYRVTGDPDFLDFRDAMMAADYPAYSGVHRSAVQDAFADKGVGLYSRPEISISGPHSIDEGDLGTWSSQVSGGTGSYSYTWYKYKPQQTPQLVSTAPTYAANITGSENFTLVLTVTSPNSDTGQASYSVTVTGEGCPQPGFCQ